MTEPQSFSVISYQKHENHFNDHISGGAKSNIAKTWFNKDTVDAWRHDRIRRVLMPLLNYFPESNWLTVGDGRYGTDAHFLKENGINALATDISDVLLKEGKELGFIDDFAKENAEKLSFGNDQFDFVYCKEAYHHFPRPIIALHEMIRVAKIGVVLTEPKDPEISSNFIKIFFRNLNSFVKEFLGKKGSTSHNFEVVGNYVYTISEREIEKVALGINLQYVAFKVMYDHYIPGVEFEQSISSNKVFQKVKSRIALLEILDRLGLNNRGLLTAVIFKEPPSEKLQTSLNSAGFKLVKLPKNPYL
ncbi:2-methyl-6-phytyl-1,4-hydroquinone methyltransferase [Nostoc sp. NIES-4103]|nr:2-methyl-6-phytyl-1,4-hydroquinone methyltransferase [Nostoc sp. NIES-4103]